MQANTVRDLGAQARSARRAQGLTQADLARQLGVSREWVVRFESGHPRLEAQKVLDALSVLGLVLHVGAGERHGAEQRDLPAAASRTVRSHKTTRPSRVTGAKTGARTSTGKSDPFEALFAKQKR